MNERIQELARQARKNSARWGVYMEEEFYEKFAELIVQECMSLCQECIDDGCIEAEEPMRKIEQYFGVDK